ncbi:MAG: hydrolase, partial [Aeromicrobium sp.]
MRVSLVQLASSTDSTSNRALVEARLGSLDGSADLVVLPEGTMHDFGATDHDLSAAAEPLDGPFVAMLAEQA